MKRYIRTSTIYARYAALEKEVRGLLWSIFHEYTNPDHDPYSGYDDPDRFSNQLEAEFIDLYNSGKISLTWPEYVYQNRDKLFRDRFIDAMDAEGFYRDDAEREHMIEYFDSLTPTDYNRILYLSRDWKDMRRRSNTQLVSKWDN